MPGTTPRILIAVPTRRNRVTKPEKSIVAGFAIRSKIALCEIMLKKETKIVKYDLNQNYTTRMLGSETYQTKMYKNIEPNVQDLNHHLPAGTIRIKSTRAPHCPLT